MDHALHRDAHLDIGECRLTRLTSLVIGTFFFFFFGGYAVSLVEGKRLMKAFLCSMRVQAVKKE